MERNQRPGGSPRSTMKLIEEWQSKASKATAANRSNSERLGE